MKSVSLTAAGVVAKAEQQGMKIERFNNGAHVRIHLKGKMFVDVYPTTGRWMLKGAMGTSMQVSQLHKEVFGALPPGVKVREPTPPAKRQHETRRSPRALELDLFATVMEAQAKRIRLIANGHCPKKHEAPNAIVSDHALVRFLERVMGIDVEAIREKVAALIPPVPPEDDGYVRIVKMPAGQSLIMKSNTVVTVLDAGMRDPSARNDAGQATADAIGYLEVAAKVRPAILEIEDAV